jgi:hypothetical protein
VPPFVPLTTIHAKDFVNLAPAFQRNEGSVQHVLVGLPCKRLRLLRLPDTSVSLRDWQQLCHGLRQTGDIRNRKNNDLSQNGFDKVHRGSDIQSEHSFIVSRCLNLP